MPQVRRNLTAERVQHARRLRGEPSVAEKVAWKFLRHGKIGFRFRRQHAIGRYILDFYCPEALLALEFDGEQHDSVRDAERDRWFLANGIATLRIPNREFFGVDEPSRDWLAAIVIACEERTGRRAWE